MRVLVLTNWYPPHHRGGYELACFDVTQRLLDRGHEVTVLCSDQRMPGVDDVPEAHVTRRLQMYFDENEPTRPSLRQRLELERHNQRILDEQLDRDDPDVVFVWHLGALSQGLLTTVHERGLPLVYSICDDWLAYGRLLDPWARMFTGRFPRGLVGRLLRPLVGVPTTLPDLDASGLFCFISETTRTAAIQRTPWTFPRSTIVFSGIDERLFDGSAANTQPWTWRLLYAGRFDPRKGIETLLRAMALLPEATLTLDGRGSSSEVRWVQDLISEHELEARVAVMTSPRHELPRRYATADVVVFPSEWAEPFGLVPLEAMSCGTPVVATGAGGSGEYLQHEANCLLYEAGDANALAAAVRRVADDGDLRERLIAGGRRTAPLLTAARLTEAFVQCLDAAVNGHGAPRDRAVPDFASVGSTGDAGDVVA